MLSPEEFKPIAESLHEAFNRAELEVIGHVHHWDRISQKYFRQWLWENYGISVGIEKKAIPGDNAAIERHVWELFGWSDNEKLVMFKLTYG